MLLLGEWKKLLGIRYFWLLLAVLFLANTILCFVSTDAPERELSDAVEQLCSRMEEDPAGMEKKIGEAKKLIEEKQMLLSEELDRKLEEDPDYQFTMEELQVHTELLDGVHNDSELLWLLQTATDAKENYENGINTILSQAYRQMKQERADGMTMDDYAYKYQAYVYARYTTVKDTTVMPTAFTSGWSEFFSFHYVDIFLYAAMLLLSGLLFIPEKQTGMLPILRSCKRGRGRVALCKTGLAALLSCLITLCFLAAEFAVIEFETGFSDPSLPVQILPAYMTFPATCTIGEFFLLFVLLKLLGFMAFTAAATFFSVVFYQPILTYFTGAVFFGISFFLNRVGISALPSLKALNLLSVTEVTPVTARLSAVNFFGFPLQYLYVALIGSLLLLLGFSGGAIALHTVGKGGVRLTHLPRLLEKCALPFRRFRERLTKLSAGKKTRPVKYREHSLLGWEMRKTIRFGGIWILLVLLLGTQIWMGVSVKENYYPNYNYRLYLRTIRGMEGELTDRRIEEINKESAEKQEIIDRFNSVIDDFSKGKITAEEYSAFTEEYSRAQSRMNGLQLVRQKAQYLTERFEETGVRGWLCDTEAYENLFATGFCLPLYAVILLLGTVSYCMEYAGKNQSDRFISILSSTPYGRRKTLRAKCLSVLLLSLGAAVVFYAIQFGFYASTYDFSAFTLQAPLLSMQTFEKVGSALTVGQYLGIFYGVRLIAAPLLGLLTVACSALLEKLLSTISVTVFATVIPTLLLSFGLSAAGYADFLGWSGAQDGFLFSAEKNIFASDFGFLLLFTAAVVAVTSALLVAADRKHGK